MKGNNDNILEMININKDFSGVQVLYDVNFTLKRGEAHAIVGQNGAGKSVLMKILSGVHVRSSGKVIVDGEEVSYSSPKEARARGIGMIFQEFSLIPTMSVAKNIFLNREPKSGGIVRDSEMLKASKEILDELGVDINPKESVKNLSVSNKQLVEIGKVVSQDRKIIVMDEPTASLTRSEVKTLNKVIKRLKEKGISIVYITHHLKEIFDICDRVTVLRDGRKIVTEKISDIILAQLIEAMLGKKLKSGVRYEAKHEIVRSGTPKLEVRDLDLGGKEKISFKLWNGEVLGIAGLMGAGQGKVIKAIFGILPELDKKMEKDGKVVSIKKPDDSLKHKITMVPEERQAQGLIVEHTIKANVNLSILDKIKGLLFVNDRKANNITQKYVDDLNIVTDSIFKKVKLLSGGNQQKVVIAKILAAEPDIMILNDPNFGVDVGSKQEIIKIIREFTEKEDRSAIFISSEFGELAQICDRVIIMKGGSIIDEVIREEGPPITEELLLHAVQ